MLAATVDNDDDYDDNDDDNHNGNDSNKVKPLHSNLVLFEFTRK